MLILIIGPLSIYLRGNRYIGNVFQAKQTKQLNLKLLTNLKMIRHLFFKVSFSKKITFLLFVFFICKSSLASDVFKDDQLLFKPKEKLVTQKADYVITGKVIDEAGQPLIAVSIV